MLWCGVVVCGVLCSGQPCTKILGLQGSRSQRGFKGREGPRWSTVNGQKAGTAGVYVSVLQSSHAWPQVPPPFPECYGVALGLKVLANATRSESSRERERDSQRQTDRQTETE